MIHDFPEPNSLVEVVPLLPDDAVGSVDIDPKDLQHFGMIG